MQIQLSSENRVLDWLNFHQSFYKKACVVTAATAMARRMKENILSNDNLNKGYLNVTVESIGRDVDFTGIGDGTKLVGYDLVVIVPDHIPLDIIKSLL